MAEIEKLLQSKNGNFILYKQSGIGNNETPYEELRVRSEGEAEKHVVEIRFDYRGCPRFDGAPVHYKYTGVNIAHGMRMKADTLNETLEYIAVLQEAYDFANTILRYIEQNEEWLDY